MPYSAFTSPALGDHHQPGLRPGKPPDRALLSLCGRPAVSVATNESRAAAPELIYACPPRHASSCFPPPPLSPARLDFTAASNQRRRCLRPPPTRLSHRKLFAIMAGDGDKKPVDVPAEPPRRVSNELTVDQADQALAALGYQPVRPVSSHKTRFVEHAQRRANPPPLLPLL